eukprot:CAMPEP_0113492096 /NCGR_PEP_ID=MMETSP0014_2-20120614/27894_1 /TAXON_ID=2857 /ORGANISM="Nitzschia sp." /LENGTH=479 /DNA_ID=CAMNT_0000385905 /DNA_START=632 /DNA_END=2071 /DNA_ORIENTATION=- /assembly_acc=CAM_ASM_000159
MCLPKQPKSLQLKGRGLAGHGGGVKAAAAAAAANPVAMETMKATNSNVEKEEGGYDDPRSFITNVSSEDVVLGRGAGPNEMAGNIAFRQIVAQFKPSYITTVNRKAKSQIAHKVVQTVKSKRGRFLRRARIQGSSTSTSPSSSSSSGAGASASASAATDQDIFVEAEEEVILEKAKQALRYGKRDNGRRSDQWTSSPPSSSSSSSPSPTHRHHLPLHDVISPNSHVARPPIRQVGQVGQGRVPMTLKTMSLSATTGPGVAAAAAAAAAAPIGGVVPTRNTPTIAFLLQRQNQTHSSQTRREVQANAEQRTPTVPMSSSTMATSSLSSNSLRHRPAIVNSPRRPTESDVIDEALAASVRESSSDEEMVQLLIDRAIAVRHQSPRASTQLLDLVESLIGKHKTVPSLPVLCRSQNLVQNSTSLPSDTQRGRIVSPPSTSRNNVAKRFYNNAVPTITASNSNRTHHDAAAKVLATLGLFLKA